MKYPATLLIILIFTATCHGQDPQPFSEISYPFEVHYTELENGETIAYHESGTGEDTLILIHGLGSYMPAWKMNIGALGESYRIIALDLPGYGKSTKGAENFTLPFFAESVVQLMDKIGIEKASVAGHSMGGQISLYLAANYADRVSHLILSAPAGFEQFTEQDQMMFRATISPAAIAATPEPMIRQNVVNAFYNYPDQAEFMVVDRIKKTEDPDFDAYAKAQAESIFGMLETPVWELMPDILQPVLIVFGKQDALIPNPYLHPDLTTERVAQEGAERLPDATLTFIDNAGHFVHFEKPGEFNRAVVEFLNQN